MARCLSEPSRKFFSCHVQFIALANGDIPSSHTVWTASILRILLHHTISRSHPHLLSPFQWSRPQEPGITCSDGSIISQNLSNDLSITGTNQNSQALELGPNGTRINRYLSIGFATIHTRDHSPLYQSRFSPYTDNMCAFSRR